MTYVKHVPIVARRLCGSYTAGCGRWKNMTVVFQLLLLLMLLTPCKLFSADYTWDRDVTSGFQTGDGTWGTNDYWTLTGGGGTVLAAWPGTGNSATFAGSTNGAYAIQVNGTQYVDSISVLDSSYTIWGGTSLEFGDHASIYVASTKKVYINMPMTSTNGIRKFGTGMLVIIGTNPQPGTLTIDQGVVMLGAAAAYGMVAGDIIDNDSLVFNQSDTCLYTGNIGGTGVVVKKGNDTLFCTGSWMNAGGVYVTNGIFMIGYGGTTGSVSGAIATSVPLIVNRSDTYTHSGVISGTGAVTVKGSGTIIFTGTNTYTGQTTISAGTMQIGAGGTAGSFNTTSAIANEGTLRIMRSDSLHINVPINGAGTFEQAGTGKTILSGYNNYSGNTIISDGTLQVGDGSSMGNLGTTNSVQNDGVLVFNLGSSQTVSAPISGSGSVLQNGSGNITLASNCTYTGTTTIRHGGLVVLGSLAAPVTVDTAGTLMGNGVLSGVVNVGNGGGISPGNYSLDPAKLTTGSIALDDASILTLDIGSTGTDTLAVQGNLVLDGFLNIGDIGGAAAGTYTVITVTGTITDNGLIVGTVPYGYYCTVNVGTNTVSVTLASIPVREWIGGGGNGKWSTPGNWSGSIIPTSSDSVVFQSASSPCTLDVNIAVRSLNMSSGYTQNFYMNHKKITITNAFEMNMSGTIVTDSLDTLCFDGVSPKSFYAPYGKRLPVLHKTGTGSMVLNGSMMCAAGLRISGGSFHINYSIDTVLSKLVIDGGALDFGSGRIVAYGDVDFDGADAIVNSGGVLEFASAELQNFIPGNGNPHPAVVYKGTSSLHIHKNRLHAKKLTVQSDTVIMDTALTVDTLEVMSGCRFLFDTTAGTSDTVNYLGGYGTLDFGKTGLTIAKSLLLSQFAGVTGDVSLLFDNTDSIMFEPPVSSFTFRKIEMRGGGKVQRGANSLITKNMFLHQGIWAAGTLSDSVADTLGVYGGELRIGATTFKVHHLLSTAGALHFNTGILQFSGNGGKMAFAGLNTIYRDTGSIAIIGGGNSLYEISADQSFPRIQITAAPTDTVRMKSAMHTTALVLNSGYFDLGTFGSSADSLTVYGGVMNFTGSILEVSSGKIDLAGLAGVVGNDGLLRVWGSVSQTLTSPTGTVTLPVIEKRGSGTLNLDGIPLHCKSLYIMEGSLNCNGIDMTIDDTFSVASTVTAPLYGIDGITIAVSGDAILRGQAGNILQLNPATVMQINAGGTLSASYANISNCTAGGVQGLADLTSTNGGGNTNWLFLADDLTAPSPVSIMIDDGNGYTNDSDPLLQISAVDADSMRIALPGDTNGASWRRYATVDSIAISNGGDEEKFIWVQFKDLAGNRSGWIYDSTIYDATAPVNQQITITDRNGYTNDADPPLQLSVTGADSMRIALAADTAASSWRPNAAADSIVVSGGGDGKKTVCIQFKDRAGNRTGWVYDSTVYDVTAPSNVQVAVVDKNGFTSDADPRLQISATGADSVRIAAAAADTAAAVWKPFTTADSIIISVGGDGKKTIYTQCRDYAGNRSAWISDTTNYDLTAPVISNVINGSFIETTWPGEISGQANDVGAGTDSVKVTIRRDQDAYYWNGTGWQNTAIVLVSMGGDGVWSVSLSYSELEDGQYTVAVTAVDKVGNTGGTPTESVFTYVKKPEALFSASPVKGPVPLDVVFNDTSTGEVTARTWDFGDGTSDTTPQVTHQYTAWGNYTVTLTVSGPGGSDTVISDTLIHAVPPPPVAVMSVSATGGSAPLPVTFNDLSTGQKTGRLWRFGDGSTDTATNPVHIYRSAGVFTATLIETGAGGTDSATSPQITVTDTTAPSALQSLTASALSCSAIIVTWKQPPESDADSVAFVISDTGYAATTDNALLKKKFGAKSGRDTINGIPPVGMTVWVSGFVVDASGNVSPAGTSSKASVTLGDCTPPEYALRVSLSSIGDTVFSVTVTTDQQKEIPSTIRYGTGTSHQKAIDSSTVTAFTNTLSFSRKIRIPGWWYVVTSVGDASGNFSEVHTDSISIADVPPAVLLDDTATISEDKVWSRKLAANDYNGDAVTFALVSAPAAVSLKTDTLFWMPDDKDIGKSTIRISATDSRGKSTVDSIIITVVNVEEAPVAVFSGDTAAWEDKLWRAKITVTDPDPADTHSIVLARAPKWVSLKGDTLSGTPAEDQSGTNTVVCIVKDRTGLGDTVVQRIQTYAVNDTPTVVVSQPADTVLYEKDTAVMKVIVKDPDRGDSVFVSLKNAPSWVSLSSYQRDTAGRETGCAFILAPQQADTGMKTFTIVFSDRMAASRTSTVTIRIKDADDAPSQPKVVRQSAGGALECKAVATDDRDSLIEYHAELRAGDDTSFVISKTSSTGLFRFYPLDDAAYVLKITALDRQNNSSQPYFDTVVIKGATRHITADTAWEMVSVPRTLPVATVKNTRYLLHWDESIEEKQVYHYYLQKTEIDSIHAGYAYWRKGVTKDTVVISTRNRQLTPATITLTAKDQGWNQVASPYPYPVIWHGDNRTLWKWNGTTGDFEEADSILEPWQGYWYQSDSTASVVIDTVPRFPNTRLAKKKQVWYADVHNWIFSLVLSAPQGGDAVNRFGVRPDAQNGYDEYDRPEPPRIIAGGSLYFPHADWKKGITQYSTDVRKSWNDLNVFEFCITGSTENSSASLRIEGYDAGTPLYFYMSGDDSLTQVKYDDSIPVVLRTSAMYKTLFVVKDPSKIKLVPMKFSLGNPYPNPFCPSTRIQYVLPYRWEKNGKLIDSDYRVRVDIYDMLGRKVRTLVHRTMKPGVYQLFWDGKNGAGRVAGSGNYFIRFKADSFEGVRKLVMVR